MSKVQAVSINERVQRAIEEMVESGAEQGLQVAAYQHREQIIDAVAGLADPKTGRAVTPETPFYCYSVCKPAASTLVHMLAERRALTYDTRVAEVWPEFAARGKDGVTIRQVLNHTAGVPGIPLTTTIEDLCNWDKMCSAIAGAELWWKPGTKIGYHAYTFGYIVGEVIRRVTGKRISQLLHEEVSGPLGVERELYFGMPQSEHHRLAVLEDAPMPPDFQMPAMPPDLPMFKAAPMSLMPNAAFGNRPDTLAADIPAGGKTSARAIARMYAALLGKVDGVQLLTPARLEQAVGDLRVLLQERLEVPFRDRCHRDVGVGGDCRAAAFVVEQGHLTEGVAWPELARVPLNRLHADRAVGDNHEPDAALAADHDLVTGRMLDGLELLFDRPHL